MSFVRNARPTLAGVTTSDVSTKPQRQSQTLALLSASPSPNNHTDSYTTVANPCKLGGRDVLQPTSNPWLITLQSDSWLQGEMFVARCVICQPAVPHSLSQFGTSNFYESCLRLSLCSARPATCHRIRLILSQIWMIKLWWTVQSCWGLFGQLSNPF